MINRLWRKFGSYSKSDTISAITALFSSNVITSIIGVVGAFIQGRFVTPDDLGYFRQYSIISNYLFFLHLGIFHAIEKMYPYYIGRGEKEKATNVVQIGNAWMILVCVPLCLAFFIAAIVTFIMGNWKGALGWLAQDIALLTSLYGGFLNATYRSGQDFKKMAKSQIIGPVVSLLSLPVFWIQSYIALFLRSTIPAISLWILHKNRPVKVKWRFSFREWKELVKQGLPRFSASYATTTGLEALRATIILQLLGTSDLGYWSFSWMVITIAMQLPQAITAVFTPKIIELYGNTNSPSKSYALSKKPIVSGAIAFSIIVPIGILATLKVLPLILPLYADTAGVIAILLLCLPLKLIEAPASILNAMNKLVWINICAITNAVIQILFMIIGIWLGWGLYSVAIGFFAGNFVRVIMVSVIIKYACKAEKENTQIILHV